MSGDPPLRAPVGADADRWNTFPGEKILVVATRTLTSAVRVLECLPAILRNDPRITVVFAHDPTSAFNDGVLPLLHSTGAKVMPWEQLRDIKPDLILSATENLDLPDGDCPVLVLPHGIGFQKLVPDSRTSNTRLSGVVPDGLLRTGRARLAVSHPAQEAQLRAAHPAAAGNTVWIGDPCYDELLASADQSDAYKAALGVPEHCRLLLISSTWGPTSLLGRHPDLPARLLGALPYDSFRVAAVVHPNVWAAHGAWQLRNLLADALDAGLILLPPAHAWRSALVAADVVIGDHGSVTLYGAALRKAILLAAFGEDSVPGTAAAQLRQTTPRLEPHGDLHQQIIDVVRDHNPDRYTDISAAAFAWPGQALQRLQTAVYDLMNLAVPANSQPPRALILPLPDQTAPEVTAWRVTTTPHPDGSIGVRRHPYVVSHNNPKTPGSFVHLACDTRERNRYLLESASVLIHTETPVTDRQLQDTLNRFPGSLIAAGGSLMALRDGRVIKTADSDPAHAAAIAYTQLRQGLL